MLNLSVPRESQLQPLGMMEDGEFDLSNFLADSLSLQANSATPTRMMFPLTPKDHLLEMFKQDPLYVLGERSFGKPRQISEDTIGTPIQEFFRGVNVLITGGTGFIGKVLIEKLVRSIPHLGHVYVLIRAKRGQSAQERFEELLEDKVFLRMKTEVPEYGTKILHVNGELSSPDLGLSSADRNLLSDKIHVVFHSAADVRFLEPLRVAVMSNVLGSKYMLDLAKQMTNLRSYVHVSTAFSQCVRRVIDERVHKMSVGYKELLNCLDTMTDEQILKETTRLLQGWPNTYTFSKALCEDMMLEEAEGLPVCIYRPSIVWPTYREPIRGWIDNVYGPTGLLLGTSLGVIHVGWNNLELTLDTVPVDYVVNSMIASAWKTGSCNRQEPPSVFNFVSTPARPLTWKRLTVPGFKYAQVWPFSQAIWYMSFITLESSLGYDIAVFFLHRIPGFIFDKLAVITGQQPRLLKIHDKIRTMKEQLGYFVFSIWEFQNDNVMDLWNSMSTKDKEVFHFDLSNVGIDEQLVLGKLGLRYYYLKDKMETIPAAERKAKWLYVAHVTFQVLTGLAALKLMVLLAHVLPL